MTLLYSPQGRRMLFRDISRESQHRDHRSILLGEQELQGVLLLFRVVQLHFEGIQIGIVGNYSVFGDLRHHYATMLHATCKRDSRWPSLPQRELRASLVLSLLLLQITRSTPIKARFLVIVCNFCKLGLIHASASQSVAGQQWPTHANIAAFHNPGSSKSRDRRQSPS